MTDQERAKHSLKMGEQHPYDDEGYADGPKYGDPAPAPARDWAHRAARGILADLSDRRGVRHELESIDMDVRQELAESLADIIRMAESERGDDKTRTYMLDDIMLLLAQNRDVHRQYYAKVQGKKPKLTDPLMTREDFQRFPEEELAEAYKHVVMRCFRQR